MNWKGQGAQGVGDIVVTMHNSSELASGLDGFLGFVKVDGTSVEGDIYG